MNRCLFTIPFCLGALLVSTAGAEDLMPPSVRAQLGLTEAWSRPMNVPVGAQSIADQQIFVHHGSPREYVEVVTAPPAAAAPAAAKAADPAAGDAAAAPEPVGEVLVRIPTDRLGTNGMPIGRAEAERLARNEIRRLKRRGVTASLNVRTVPQVYLYTLATNGALECRDAESGEPLWMVLVGDRRLPYSAIGVNEDFLTVINGANLYKVEAATGEVIEEVVMSGAPRFGAINAGDYAMIPVIGGGVEGYPLADPTRDPFMEIVNGAALAMPTKAPGSSRTAWGTDAGFVYVMEMQGTPSVLFRLETDGIVSGRIAAAPGDRFFFGSDRGQVYGLRATRSGIVLWSQPFGEPFYNDPMVVDQTLLIRSTYGNLFALHVDTGVMVWPNPLSNVGELVAAFGGRAYVTTPTGALSVIDIEKGELVANFNRLRPSRFLVNRWNDRIYLVSDKGEVQCLRRNEYVLPEFTSTPDTVPEEEVKPAAKKPGAAAAGDPFGGGGDPFGAGAGGGGDPFGGGGGGGGDPFGGGGDAGGDPFGGGGGGDGGAMDDPFGGNPFGN